MQIRLASLLPENLDLGAAARDLELLTERLAQVPGFTFARLIRDVLLRARRRRVLPPAPLAPERRMPAESRARLEPLPVPRPRVNMASTARAAQPQPWPAAAQTAAASPAPASLSPATTLDSTLFSGSPRAHPADDAAPTLDFMYAEQLWPKAPAAPGDPASPDAFALDAWFPFPPLGERDHSQR